jgi:putative RNA 2'-phosphotransferase
MLGHRPDEFGLVPDGDGFLTHKEIIQALHEESGFSYVRKSHINEVMLSKNRHLFRNEEGRLRVLERRWRFELDKVPETLPHILFTAVRRRAHPVVMEKGLKRSDGNYLILTPDKEVALRIGRRRDQNPVLLEIRADDAKDGGIHFHPFGSLFLCRHIPANFISGPPVSKELMEGRIEAAPQPVEFSPGTFTLDTSKDPDLRRRLKGKKPKGWKEEVRKVRRRKRQ